MTLGNPSRKEIDYFHEAYISDVSLRIINESDKLRTKISNTSKDFTQLQ